MSAFAQVTTRSRLQPALNMMFAKGKKLAFDKWVALVARHNRRQEQTEIAEEHYDKRIKRRVLAGFNFKMREMREKALKHSAAFSRFFSSTAQNVFRVWKTYVRGVLQMRAKTASAMSFWVNRSAATSWMAWRQYVVIEQDERAVIGCAVAKWLRFDWVRAWHQWRWAVAESRRKQTLLVEAALRWKQISLHSLGKEFQLWAARTAQFRRVGSYERRFQFLLGLQALHLHFAFNSWHALLCHRRWAGLMALEVRIVAMRTRKRCAYNRWAYEFGLIKKAKRIMHGWLNASLVKAFQAMRLGAQLQREAKVKARNALAFMTGSVTLKCFRKFGINARSQQKWRAAIASGLGTRRRRILAAVLRALRTNRNVSALKKYGSVKAQRFWRRILLLGCLRKWLYEQEQQRKLRRALASIRHRTVKKCFAQLRTNALGSKDMNQKMRSVISLLQNGALHRTFHSMRAYAENSAYKRERIEVALEHYERILKRNALRFMRWGTTAALQDKILNNKCISHIRNTLMNKYLWRWKDIHMQAMSQKHKMRLAFGKYMMSATQRAMFQLNEYARSSKYASAPGRNRPLAAAAKAVLVADAGTRELARSRRTNIGSSSPSELPW